MYPISSMDQTQRGKNLCAYAFRAAALLWACRLQLRAKADEVCIACTKRQEFLRNCRDYMGAVLAARRAVARALVAAIRGLAVSLIALLTRTNSIDKKIERNSDSSFTLRTLHLARERM